MDANEGWWCPQCRKEMAEAEVEVPCETEGGILPDGTCQYGYPELSPAAVEAFLLWQDMNAMGWEAATELRQLSLSRAGTGALLVRLRSLFDEQARLDNKRMKVATGGDKT